jgi:hypothetical protein
VIGLTFAEWGARDGNAFRLLLFRAAFLARRPVKYV